MSAPISIATKIKSIEHLKLHPTEVVKYQYFIVKTSSLALAGLQKGDVLTIIQNVPISDGQLVILLINNQWIVRKVECSNGFWRFVSVCGRLADLDWPYLQPLPLVGVVKMVSRDL